MQLTPVHAMLVEVIRGRQTSDHAVARTVMANKMGRKRSGQRLPRLPGEPCAVPYFGGFNMLLRDGADFRRWTKVMERWGWPWARPT